MTSPSQIPQRLAIIALFALACAAPLGATAKPFQEAGVSRWGGDYERFMPIAGGADACAKVCAGDDQCRAWSYIQPGVTGPAGECRLKASVPDARPDPCCVSGVAAGSSDDTLYIAAQKQPSAEKQRAAGTTAATAKKPASKSGKDRPEDSLQMPIEAETPEALKAIAAPVGMAEPSVLETNP